MELQTEARELRLEVRELKDMLTHTHHRWWTQNEKALKEADELITKSNQPYELKY